MRVTPLHDRVLVRCLEEGAPTIGRIIIPDAAREKPQEGQVLAVGKGKLNDKGQRVPLEVKVGDPPRKAPASSDHVRAIVSRLFRFGISQGMDQIEYNPAIGIERAKPAGKRTGSWALMRSSACGGCGRMSSPPKSDRSSVSSSN